MLLGRAPRHILLLPPYHGQRRQLLEIPNHHGSRAGRPLLSLLLLPRHQQQQQQQQQWQQQQPSPLTPRAAAAAAPASASMSPSYSLRSLAGHLPVLVSVAAARNAAAAATQRRLHQQQKSINRSHSHSLAHSSTRPSAAAAMDPPTIGRRSSGSSPLRTSPNGVGNGGNGGAAGDRKKPFLIGVAGGTASGKSTVCQRIMEDVCKQQNGIEKKIISLSQDSFYRELSETEITKANAGAFNFDHPDAFDHELMLDCLRDIQEGKPTKVPIYDFKTNARKKDQFTTICPSDVVLLEGILIFYFRDVRDMFDMKLFVDTDADTRLARRVLRDIEQRGRDLEHVLLQYTTLVKPAFEEFCLPTKKFADVIIPRGADNTVAIELVAQHIQDIIWTRNSSSKSGSPFSRSRSNSDSMIR